jgi:ubiquinone/menaquinone biosynthesis C-methylase UbiE
VAQALNRLKGGIISIDFSTVTELAGDEITQEQFDRLCHRYYWAGTYCVGKDVIEGACGTGPGLGYLAKRAKSLRAGDYTTSILAIAKQHYAKRIDLLQFDMQAIPFNDHLIDIVILFEAIYYLTNAGRFVAECQRVLRPGGKVLIASANKDLYDFNPSPFSQSYYGVLELNKLFKKHGFTIDCFGYMPVGEISHRQKVLRPIKKLAVLLNLIPKTSRGKKWLKRLVFGRMTIMPAEIEEGMLSYIPPQPLTISIPDLEHKVIYCAATVLA